MLDDLPGALARDDDPLVVAVLPEEYPAGLEHPVPAREVERPAVRDDALEHRYAVHGGLLVLRVLAPLPMRANHVDHAPGHPESGLTAVLRHVRGRPVV